MPRKSQWSNSSDSLELLLTHGNIDYAVISTYKKTEQKKREVTGMLGLEIVTAARTTKMEH
jgi:hypothetical protein